MTKKKISIIGKGTAGSITTSYLAFTTNAEIDWYFDPDIPEQAVGEGSTLNFPYFLSNFLNITYNDLINNLEGTYKTGIKKINYKGTGDFLHSFPLGYTGIHFSANTFQKLILQKLKNQVNFIPTKVTDYKHLDSNYIVDCSGSPTSLKEYYKKPSIPVNSAYITQCYWNKPEFDYTLTIARPYGWVFAVPLQNRCSVGYLYNKNINTLEEVKEDVKNIFTQYNLLPSNNTNSFNFNNYYKKQNFTDRIAYNGNSSFFLEPLEATSIYSILSIAEGVSDFLKNERSLTQINTEYNLLMEEIEQMIMLHYFAGSKFNTPFWENAYNNSLPSINSLTSSPKFKSLLSNINNQNTNSPLEYGTWSKSSFSQNLTNLGILDKITQLTF